MLFILGACSITKDGLQPGLPGCPSLKIAEGQLSVPGIFTANGKDILYHRVDNSCNDVKPHNQGIN